MGTLILVLGLLLGTGGDVARTLTTYQTEAMEAPDRSTFVRVYIENADATMVNVCEIDDGYGGALDFLRSITIEADADHPIGAAEIVLAREIDGLSLSPLMEGSTLNLDSGGSYAPHINPARFVSIETAVMKQGDQPSSGDYEPIWEGYIDEPEFGGLSSEIKLSARDPISRLNDTIIESISTYGGGSPLTEIDVVMQQILDDNMGSGEFPLWVVGDPDFGIEEYDLANVSVLDALKALADLQGWNLHWLWHESPGEFRLTYYEPDRSDTTASWTFGPDDYYDLPGLKLAQSGIRNAGEVVYRDSDGDEQTVTQERSSSVAIYGRRFIRLDERASRQITTSAQATALLTAVLDDLYLPVGAQRMDAPFHWPVELGDVHDYSSNDVHYDTTQTFAVFGFTHIITQNRIRTYINASGQPSGGYRRWHDKEGVTAVYSHLDTSERSIAGDEMVGAEDTIATITIPGGVLGSYRAVAIEVYAETHDAFNNGAVMRLRLNGDLLIAVPVPAVTTYEYTFRVSLANNRSPSVQDVATEVIYDATGANPLARRARTTHAEDSTAPIDITVTIDWVGASASDVATVHRTFARLVGSD